MSFFIFFFFNHTNSIMHVNDDFLDEKECYEDADCNNGYCHNGDCLCSPEYNYKHDCSVYGCKFDDYNILNLTHISYSSKSSVRVMPVISTYISNLYYSKVVSSRLSWLVALPSTFRIFMKGKCDAYVL